ncbi:MAG TPA: TonB-dependent receptor [Steroidobacteraceae bacterium]|nr:TonB-dependent receptor [Steroidobacteraceae bacterium]
MAPTPAARRTFALAALLLAPSLHAATLEEVIVTATRSPVALKTYAGSATRIAGDDVTLVGATHSSELVNRAPGAMIQRGSGEESLTALRSPVLTGAGACGSVLVLEDGIPIRPVGTCNVNELFEVNLEQAAAIEVLRGPGSVLYGSSAVHGIINVIPPMPAGIPAFGAAVEYGSDAYRRLFVGASSDRPDGGLGIVMNGTDDGGWRDASGFEEEKLNAVWARAVRGGALKMTLSGSNLDQETAGFIVGKDAYRDPAIARSNPDPEAYRNASSLRFSTQYRGASGNELRVFLRSSRMDFLQHFLLGQPIEQNGQDSGGIMLATTGRVFAGGELIAGLDAELGRSTLLQFQNHPTTDGPPPANAIRPAGRQYDYDVDSQVYAGYGEWRRPLAPHWSLEAGLRLEFARYDYDNRMIEGNTDENGVPCPGGCLYSRPADRSDDFTNLAPRLGLVWSLSEDATAYVSLTRGFRAPEATELYRLQRQQTVADLDSERADSAELGFRWRSDALSLDLALFHMDKENVILRDSSGFNVSGGRTRHRGVEYEGDWAFAGDWLLSAAGTYARHEYRFSAAVDQGEQITSGNDIDTAPRDIHSLRLRRNSAWLDAELEWLWVGPYWANAANTAHYGGHDVGNLRLTASPAKSWSFTLRVMNLLDTAYADRADFAFGDYRYFPGRGRAYFAEIGWRRE